MNLAEYRRELKAAQLEFSAAVQEASDRMGKRIAVADEAFFEDKDTLKVTAEENIPARRCGF